MSNSKTNSIPDHIGLILDGNRRWARARGLPTLEGHREGYDNLKLVAEHAFNYGVKYVSAYVFSTENWNRSEDEVTYLMSLLLKFFKKDCKQLNKEGVKIMWLGSRLKLSEKILKAAEEVAGSNFIRFKKIGNIEPANVPHKTTPITEMPVTMANKKVCVPYRCGSI